MKNKLVFAVVLTAFMAVLFLAFAPADRIETVKRQLLRLVNNPPQKCFDHWSHTLYDPESARIKSSKQTLSGITVKIKAKNAFGAYISDSFRCENGSGFVYAPDIDDLTRRYGDMQ